MNFSANKINYSLIVIEWQRFWDGIFFRKDFFFASTNCTLLIHTLR